MKKLLISVAVLALFALPGMAHAEQCRNAKGQFAKCGTPGALPAGTKKAASKVAPAAKPAPAATATATAKPAPAMAPAKKGPCKDAKGKFKKC